MGNCCGTRGGHDFNPAAAAAQTPRGGLRVSVSSDGGSYKLAGSDTPSNRPTTTPSLSPTQPDSPYLFIFTPFPHTALHAYHPQKLFMFCCVYKGAINFLHTACTRHYGHSGKPGERYMSLYMYNPDFPEALSFPADEVIIVTGKIDRFTLLGR